MVAVITQALATGEQPEVLDEFGTYAEALFRVVEFTEGGSDLEPIDTHNCLALHRIGARQAWRVKNNADQDFFVAIV